MDGEMKELIEQIEKSIRRAKAAVIKMGEATEQLKRMLPYAKVHELEQKIKELIKPPE